MFLYDNKCLDCANNCYYYDDDNVFCRRGATGKSQVLPAEGQLLPAGQGEKCFGNARGGVLAAHDVEECGAGGCAHAQGVCRGTPAGCHQRDMGQRI